jgi:riboflavin synthase
MFTGIVETMGEVMAIDKEGTNRTFMIRSVISDELKIDQSVSHNGVCLTVTAVKDGTHTVSAIDETLQRTHLGKLKVHDWINLERSMVMNGRLDGHIVQGHVDQTAVCKNIEDKNGSRLFTFQYKPRHNNTTVEKGSICINGVSLTVVDSFPDSFSVAIIPYTLENTSFKFIKEGDAVNLEFDIIGKYVAKLLANTIKE